MPTNIKWAALAVALVLAGGVYAVSTSGSSYTAQVVMPSATNLVAGSPVEIDGAKAGSVTHLDTRDGKAVVTISLDSAYAPLHDGTTATISYKALLGERILNLAPGRANAPTLASGALIEGTQDRVELDQVLAALDAPTRAHLRSLLGRLSTTLSGKEDDVRSTIQALGPAAQALGQVLDAVGNDGPEIRKLVTRLATFTSTLNARRGELGQTIGNLTSATGTIARNRAQLGRALRQLPPTLDTAQRTLAKVPGTVEAAGPLLQALQPGMAKLPAVSHQLRPVLRDLRPTMAQLRPTLAAVKTLLGLTPGLLSGTNTLLPELNQSLTTAGPALAYVRPYTPELMGWLANWGSAAANYDANGHYLRAFAQEGSTSLVNNPGVLPPGVTRMRTRMPGQAEGQTWTDANGSEMQ
ncbi:MAG TPA: MlaD family protein [Nocardioides sp.]|nr:MlaD family protein [Nocardioides sp.]